MVDIAEGIPQGKALDMMESGPVEGFEKDIHTGKQFGYIFGIQFDLMNFKDQ